MDKSSWLPDLNVLTLLAGCCLAQSMDAAYLPGIGPAPLRFQIRPAFVATVSMLPPLQMLEPAVPSEARDVNATVASVDVDAPTTPTAPAPSPDTIQSSEAVAVTPPLQAPAEPAPTVPAAPVITPQMLIEFFKPVGRTNSAEAVVVSGAFLPPQPPPAPTSSAATYRLK